MDCVTLGCMVMGKKKEEVGCVRECCVGCKQASVCGSKVFCGWMRRVIDARVDDGVEFVVCPRFEVEPLEYRVYRRA